MAARVPETKIVRAGKVVSGAYSKTSGYVTLTVEVEGDMFIVEVHPETAARFHCGAAFTMTLAINAA